LFLLVQLVALQKSPKAKRTKTKHSKKPFALQKAFFAHAFSDVPLCPPGLFRHHCHPASGAAQTGNPAFSAIHQAQQLWQNPRFLQLNATRYRYGNS
jgi:hypothetical protein